MYLFFSTPVMRFRQIGSVAKVKRLAANGGIVLLSDCHSLLQQIERDIFAARMGSEKPTVFPGIFLSNGKKRLIVVFPNRFQCSSYGSANHCIHGLPRLFSFSVGSLLPACQSEASERVRALAVTRADAETRGSGSAPCKPPGSECFEKWIRSNRKGISREPGRSDPSTRDRPGPFSLKKPAPFFAMIPGIARLY
jgi:hypothetical protein